MKKIVAGIALNLLGWKTDIVIPDDIKKCVMIAAPHTSNWDIIFAILAFWKHDIKFRFFVKDNYTKSLFWGQLAKKVGAIGVDRSKGKNLVNFAIELLNDNNEIVVLVPAEATRQYTEKWKTGFYYIAKGANVPIGLSYLDYKNKIAGINTFIKTTNDIKKDFMKIQIFYQDIIGKHPKFYNKKIF